MFIQGKEALIMLITNLKFKLFVFHKPKMTAKVATLKFTHMTAYTFVVK